MIDILAMTILSVHGRRYEEEEEEEVQEEETGGERGEGVMGQEGGGGGRGLGQVEGVDEEDMRTRRWRNRRKRMGGISR